MNAAIYARKSTNQRGADDEAKSVARQIQNARAFAAEKGWTVADAHIYRDDAVSGADIRKLEDRQRLLDLIASGRAPFQVLILRDASRFSRRDSDEAFGELKRIAQAGVTVWFYQDGTAFEYGHFAANITGIVRAEMNAEYRRQIAKWTTEAMERKARAGHVTGGRVFGYDNVRVDGHVERRINDVEKKIVQQIFRLAAEGFGFTTIAKTLNHEGAPSPRPQDGRPASWAPSSVRDVLHRPLYRGEIVWNRSKKRNAAGEKQQQPRDERDWVRVPAPALQIVPQPLWQAAHVVLARHREQYQRAIAGRRIIGGRPFGTCARYLLTGLLTCGDCGGGMEARSRAHGPRGRRQAERVVFYGCASYHRRGPSICANRQTVSMRAADDAVLEAVRTTLLHPVVLRTAIDRLADELAATASTPPSVTLERELAQVETERLRLAGAVAAGGGDLETLFAAIRAREQRCLEIKRQLASLAAIPVWTMDRTAIADDLAARIADWRDLLAAEPTGANRLLRQLIVGKLTLTPEEDGYRFAGTGTVEPIIAGVIPRPDFTCWRSGPLGETEPHNPGSRWGRITSW